MRFERDDIFWAHNFGGMNSRKAVYEGWAEGPGSAPKYFYGALKSAIPRWRDGPPAADGVRGPHAGVQHHRGGGHWTVRPGLLVHARRHFFDAELARQAGGHLDLGAVRQRLRQGGGEWRIFSQHVCNDYGGPFDVVNFAADAYKRLLNPQPRKPMRGPGTGGRRGRNSGASQVGLSAVLQWIGSAPDAAESRGWPAPYETFDREGSLLLRLCQRRIQDRIPHSGHGNGPSLREDRNCARQRPCHRQIGYGTLSLSESEPDAPLRGEMHMQEIRRVIIDTREMGDSLRSCGGRYYPERAGHYAGSDLTKESGLWECEEQADGAELVELWGPPALGARRDGVCGAARHLATIFEIGPGGIYKVITVPFHIDAEDAGGTLGFQVQEEGERVYVTAIA